MDHGSSLKSLSLPLPYAACRFITSHEELPNRLGTRAHCLASAIPRPDDSVYICVKTHPLKIIKIHGHRSYSYWFSSEFRAFQSSLSWDHRMLSRGSGHSRSSVSSVLFRRVEFKAYQKALRNVTTANCYHPKLIFEFKEVGTNDSSSNHFRS